MQVKENQEDKRSGPIRATKDQREFIFEALGYSPTKEQLLIHFADLRDPMLREKWVSGGEQAGKSECGAHEIISRHIEGPIFWLCGSDYSNCRKEFEYCVRDATTLQLITDRKRDVSFPSQGQCQVKLYGGKVIIKTISLKDLIHVGQESPAGIVICEAAQINWDAVPRLRTRVAAARGWLFFCGTLEGSLGWYADKIKEYEAPNPEKAQTFYLPSWSNVHMYPGGREDPEIVFQEMNRPEDIFLERFAGKPVPPSHMVVKEFRSHIHVGDYPYNPNLPIELAIDPGGAFKSGAYAVEAIQVWGDTIVVVDEVYVRGLLTHDIVEVVSRKPWWKQVHGGVIDVASKQQHTMAMKDMPSDWDIWVKQTGLFLRCQKVEESGGIDRLRTYLKPDPITSKPGLMVNYSCKGFISECGAGKAPVEAGGPWLRNKHTGKPEDRFNHACKAIIYWLVDRYGYSTVNRPMNETSSYSPFL